MIKIILMLKHRIMPKSLHLNEINPMMDMANSPFYLLKENREWGSERPRRAGISSFGYGGVNCHVVLEEFQEPAVVDSVETSGNPELFVLSACTEEALQRQVKRLEKHIAEQPDIALSDICYTLIKGRELFPFVLAITAEDREDLLAKLHVCMQSRSLIEVEHLHVRYIDKNGNAPEITDTGLISPYRWILDAIRERDKEKFAAFSATLRGRLVLLPTYPFERESFWFEEQMPVNLGVDEPTMEKPLSTGLEMLHIAKWYTKPGLDIEVNGDATDPVIILSESANLSAKLSGLMVQKGRACVFISMNDGNWTSDAEEQIMRSDIANIIFIGSPEEADTGGSDQRPTLDNFLRAAKLMKHCRKNMVLWIALFDGHMVTETERKLDPVMSALWSMARVVQQEYKRVTVRGIDVSSEESEVQLCSYIETELGRQPPKHLAAYRNGQRWEQEYVPIQRLEKRREIVVEGKVFWVTGGLGDIGLSLASYLANKGRCSIYLTGRSSLPDRTEWEEWISRNGKEDPASRKMLAIMSMEDKGSKIALAPGDVTNRDEMSAIMRRIATECGGLHGVFHLAGIAGKGKPIYKLEPIELEETLEPKATGIRVMDQVTKEVELDYFVAYSSLSAAAGGIGMLDYSVANAYLSAYTQRRKYVESKPSIAVEWPLFGEIGMGTRTSYFNGNYVRDNSITAIEALEYLEAILEDHRPRYIVSRSENLLAVSAVEASQEVDAVAKVSVPAQELEMQALEQPLIRELSRRVAEIVEAPEGRIAPDVPLDDFGVDSQMRLQLLESLEDKFSIDLPLTLLTDHPTLLEVSRYLLQHHSEAIVASVEAMPVTT